MKKILITLLALLFMISGCQTKETYPNFTLKLFYFDTCSSCLAFKDNALPYIRETFDDNFETVYYNLDLEENLPIYNELIEQLVDYPSEYHNEVPLVVINDDFAILGYNGTSENEEIIKEIKRALKDEPLGDYFKMGRYTFKQGE